ncbi:MAG: hypothetical protein CSA70_11925 [Rhodobacterales bacterium]|nr:MAG: hypothetical protein CSA70_11925 [Rhodobacterales bacterium]
MAQCVALVLSASLVMPGTAASAKSADDAVMDCMFSVKGSGYLAVSGSMKNGVSLIRYKKTRQARKDKVSKAQLEKIQSDMSACVNTQMAKG